MYESYSEVMKEKCMEDIGKRLGSGCIKAMEKRWKKKCMEALAK